MSGGDHNTRGRETSRPLTADEKLWAIMRATGGFARSEERWRERAQTGLSDADLEKALRFELGIMGGSCGPGQLHLAYQGAGLKIWASAEAINLVQDRPVFEGRATMAMARQVYGIRDPADRQLALF